MKKYFHQYSTQTNQNLYRHHGYHHVQQHPFLSNNNNYNNNNSSKSQFKQGQHNSNSSMKSFSNKTMSTPKSNNINNVSINELNLNNITVKGNNNNNNDRSKSKTKSKKDNILNNPIPSVHQQQHPIQQNTQQSFNSINSFNSLNSQRFVKQRGFSLEYIKMTKKHRIKQLLNMNSQQASMMLMAGNNDNCYRNNNFQNKVIRSKTTFDEPLDKLYQRYQTDNNNNLLRSTQYNPNSNNQFHINNETKLSSTMNNRQHLLLNKTLNDLKLPKTSSFLMMNGKRNSNSNNPLLTRIEFAGNILHKSKNQRNNLSLIENTPISFVPINSHRLNNTDRKFFGNNKNNKNATNTSGEFIDMGKTTLKKSKYSPFKTRNGSAASHNEDMKDIETKQFQQTDPQFRIKPFSTTKDVKTYKLTRHKRIKTQNNINTKTNNQDDDQIRYLSLNDSQNTINIIQQGLYGQVRLLIQLKECFQTTKGQSLLASSPSKSQKIPFNKIRQLIKIYVFGQRDQNKNKDQEKEKKHQQQEKQKENKQQKKKYHNEYFSRIDYIFQQQQEKHLIKKIVSCQRLLIICIVDLLSHQKLLNLVEEVKLTLVTLIVVYLIVWKEVRKLQTYENIDPQIAQYFDQLIKTPSFKTQSPLQKHLKSSLLPYIENLFRYSKQLFQKQCKKLIQESKSRTINRTFYQTLKKYAIYLTNNEERMVNKASGGLISSFATCPAPYILSKPQKRYTLCVDLDETLLYSKFSCAKKFQTSYRPGAKEFIIQLNKYFEIIVFTSSVKEYADQVIKPFVQFVDHVLYRYHVTRGKNLANTVKDLSRIGRKLERVIFIDDLQCNTKLQPQNSIKVTPWKGDMNDKEIIQLKGLLLAFGKDQTYHDDVRTIVSQIKQKMKGQKKKD